jgi:hypothetical protein
MLPPNEHFDGIGGCWGISSGLVEKGGEGYCKACEFYNKGETAKTPLIEVDNGK